MGSMEAPLRSGAEVRPGSEGIYLHEVLDKWFVEAVQPRCRGRTFMVRFADDFIMGFEHLEDAQKVRRVIDKRFARFGLKVNAEKTRLVPFKRPPSQGSDPQGGPGTFDFLGFTLYWGKTRRGSYVVKPKTASKRFRRALDSISQWCRENRHLGLREQWDALNAKLRGHDAYYAISYNSRMLQKLRGGSRAGVAEVAQPAQPRTSHGLGTVLGSAPDLALGSSPSRSFPLAIESTT